MNDYNVANYGIFNDAIGTTDKLANDLTLAKDTINECKNQLKNEAVIMGPTGEESSTASDKAYSCIENLSNNCNSARDYLINVGANYQSGDKQASDNIV